jgi:hypothetical protein
VLTTRLVLHCETIENGISDLHGTWLKPDLFVKGSQSAILHELRKSDSRHTLSSSAFCSRKQWGKGIRPLPCRVGT